MESKGFPKGLDLLGCLEVTLVLRDFQVLTGRFKGFIDTRDNANCSCTNYEDNKHKDEKHKKEEDNCPKDKYCKPPKVDIKVEVDEDSKFILFELTRPSAAVNLSSVLCDLLALSSVSLIVSGTTFPPGTCVVVNVDNIIYAAPAAEFCDVPITITGANGAIAATIASPPVK